MIFTVALVAWLLGSYIATLMFKCESYVKRIKELEERIKEMEGES